MDDEICSEFRQYLMKHKETASGMEEQMRIRNNPDRGGVPVESREDETEEIAG